MQRLRDSLSHTRTHTRAGNYRIAMQPRLSLTRAWNFPQSRGAAFPRRGKGVDNVNDTARTGERR